MRAFSTLPNATAYSRMHDYYASTLREDLLVLTYQHDADLAEKQAQLAQAKAAAAALEPEPVPKRNAAYTEDEAPKRRGIRAKHPARQPQTYTSQPRLERVIVHCQVKEALNNKYTLLSTFTAMRSITGQMPETVHARSNVAPWHLREGMPFGCKVELRDERMYAFVETLTEIVLPRIKEWRVLRGGSGDGLGNIALGFPAHVMGLFPEIEEVYDRIPRLSGFDVTFITSAQTNWEARLLLSGLGMPFQPRRSQVRAMLGEPEVKRPQA
ncbi:ribosomal protein L5 domain-containing protein [Syncephalis pseudoplumigaleata]|uniref:Large ribosomal subunit protein uL5m n=1 Tax=Syncephalis pseudoplumigaleata TaxID=1712513 RepID=A0A4P9Z228_9FUNG|nr:ribosomal protein L5 domain-containing protein [Syncephalis pseudoplumigaleata]|eukprot:RKP25821.1 ribosomal protein L5 domain-containing protein [Syncephalis pseudoplumigaleata]